MAAGVTVAGRTWSLGLAIATVVFASVVTGCAASGGAASSAPIVTSRPSTTVSAAVGLTRAELVRALGTKNLVLADSQAAIRPAEAPLLSVAPRAVYQVILPQDPGKGFIVVYDFLDTTRAAAAAAEQQAYLATGPGRVQRPQGAVTVLRQVGSTVVLYDWLPGASQDPSAAGVQAALETLGTGFPVAS
jgi:hypothetical protein